MYLIENTLFGERDKVETAIERAKEFEPNDRPYILAFSGGKDSICVYYILKMSGVKFKAIYSPTSCDPPELIKFIRDNFKDVIVLPYRKDKEGNLITMWSLIPRKLMPPTSMVRYCCDELKERTGEPGDTVVVGVRWAESSSRKKQSMVNMWKGKIMVRVIVDWDDNDVWTFIKRYNLPYCELYDKGFKRLGCIGCPKNPKAQKRELELYPKYRDNYIRAFDKMLEKRKEKGKTCQWENGEEVMKWWLRECSKQKVIEGQCSMF